MVTSVSFSCTMFTWTISFLYPPPFFLSALSYRVMESFLFLWLFLLLPKLSVLLSWLWTKALWNLCLLLVLWPFFSIFCCLYSMIRFHPLFSTIQIVPFLPSLRIFSVLLHRFSCSISPLIDRFLPSLLAFLFESYAAYPRLFHQLLVSLASQTTLTLFSSSSRVLLCTVIGGGSWEGCVACEITITITSDVLEHKCRASLTTILFL